MTSKRNLNSQELKHLYIAVSDYRERHEKAVKAIQDLRNSGLTLDPDLEDSLEEMEKEAQDVITLAFQINEWTHQ